MSRQLCRTGRRGGLVPHTLLRTPSYAREAKQRGQDGELALIKVLKDKGYNINHLTMSNHGSAWDVEVLDKEGNTIALFENKDCANMIGTRIDKNQKRRKLAFAKAKGEPLLFTTITLPDSSSNRKVAWVQGIRNLHRADFDQNLEGMFGLIESKMEK